MKGKWILKGIGFAVLTVLGIFAFGYVFMMLWNWLMPELFSLHTITFWQGVGLLVLGKMLFGGFRSRWGGGCGYGRCGHGNYGYGWKHRLREKMMNMTPEQRDELKRKWKEKCGVDFDEENVAEEMKVKQ